MIPVQKHISPEMNKEIFESPFSWEQLRMVIRDELQCKTEDVEIVVTFEGKPQQVVNEEGDYLKLIVDLKKSSRVYERKIFD